MSKTVRRIEITAFRRTRLAATGSGPRPPGQPSTVDLDEDLVTEISALIERLTADPLDPPMVTVSQKPTADSDE